MKKIERFSRIMFLAAGAAIMTVCIDGLVCIVLSHFSPDVILFFETEMTPVVRQLAILGGFFGIVWGSIKTPAIFRQFE